MSLSSYSLIVDVSIWILWIMLTIIDINLHIVFMIINICHFPKNNEPQENKPRVVIIGASFAGLAVKDILSKYPQDVDITLIDYKDYFEYTPGILRCFVDPTHLRSLSCLLSPSSLSVLRGRWKNVSLIQGEVVSVHTATTTTANKSRRISADDGKEEQVVILKDGQSIPYDYLVLATGSTYKGIIRPTPSSSSTPSDMHYHRQQQWDEAARELQNAKSVLIVGGGAVGVELAGEIVTKYPKKRLVLMDQHERILSAKGFGLKTSKYATKWLRSKGVELRLGVTLLRVSERSVMLDDGSVLDFDVVYHCTGAPPNSSFLRRRDDEEEEDDDATPISRLRAAVRGPRNSIVVNNHFQVQNLQHIFSAGDVCYHAESNEPKLGLTAEINGHFVAKNILRLIQNTNTHKHQQQRLLSYPHDAVGNHVTPMVYAISLGKYNGSLGFNSLVFNGRMVAVLKWILEWTKVAAVSQRPVGVVFWMISKPMMLFLGRTLLRSRKKVVSESHGLES